MGKKPLAIYIHWPFCTRICPYCDFNVYKNKDNDDGLVAAIRADLSAQMTYPAQINSVHFGGGTPSLMTDQQIKEILTFFSGQQKLDPSAEVGLEANPNDLTQDKLIEFRDAGINRLSIGVQSFHDPALKLLGRDHNGSQAKEAIEMAMSIMPSVSVDLIYGYRGQTLEAWQSDLDVALELGVQHISAYQLTIEAGTAFGKAYARGDNKAVDPDMSAEFFSQTRKRLMAGGFEHYEVSNFAKSGHRSKHNSAYWLGHDYIGVGPGAHGRHSDKTARRTTTIAELNPVKYIDRINDKFGETGLKDSHILSREDHRDEYVLMGLRLKEGISISRLNDIYPDESLIARAQDLVELGLLTVSDTHIAATYEGWLLLDHITEKLLVA